MLNTVNTVCERMLKSGVCLCVGDRRKTHHLIGFQETLLCSFTFSALRCLYVD